MLPYSKKYDKPKCNFNIDDSDLLDLCSFLNVFFKITDYESEFEIFMNNFYLENFFLKRFLKCAVEQIGIEKEIDIINPIKALVNSYNKIFP